MGNITMMKYIGFIPMPALALAVLISAAGNTLHADDSEAQKLFNDLFGGEVARVQATPDTADDLALAQTLLTAAEAENQNAELVAVLCRNIAQLASNDPEGWPTTQTAMLMLRDAAPKQVTAAMDGVVDSLQRRYTSTRGPQRAEVGNILLGAIVRLGDLQLRDGETDAALVSYRRAYSLSNSLRSPERDAIKQKMNDALDRQRIDRDIQQLKDRLKADNSDKAAARELIMTYVIDLNDPAEARKYTFLVSDPSLTDNIRRATLGRDKLTEDDAFKLGEWYRGLANQASGDATRARLLTHALNAYTRYQELHTEQDLYATRVALTVKRVEETLEKLDVDQPTYASGGLGVQRIQTWADLLALIIPDRHTSDREWIRTDKGGYAVTGSRQAWISFPARFDGEYELEVAITRREGTYFSFYVPLGNGRACSVTFGAEREDSERLIAGISNLEGETLVRGENKTMISDPILNNKLHRFAIAVKKPDGQVSVTVKLDDKTIIEWVGDPLNVYPGPSVPEANRAFPGMATYRTDLTVHTARARPLSGKMATGPEASPKSTEKKPEKTAKQKRFDQIIEAWPKLNNKQRLLILREARESGKDGIRLINELDDIYGL